VPARDSLGRALTLIPNPRDIGKFIEVLKKRPFHMLPAVNTLFNALLQHPQFRSIDFSQLCVSQAGGMAASEGTARCGSRSPAARWWRAGA
jgi:long-chain acyl-CoA synthetase